MKCKLCVRQLCSLGIVICLVFSASLVQAQRAIPDDNLAYPVLVQFSDSLASGFYLNGTNSVYLVTAKHVLFGPPVNHTNNGVMSLLSYDRDPKEKGTNVVQVDMATLWRAGEIKGHPTADVAVVRIADLVRTDSDKQHSAIRFIAGITVSTVTHNGFLGVNMDSVQKYDEVLIGNEVLLFGYPTSLGIQESPQLDPLRPLLRRGIVAGLNPNLRSTIIDCPSYPGNSGGPVVEVDPKGLGATFRVVGVVSQFVPFAEKSVNYPITYQNISISNSGYTIVTPMDFVLELVK